MPSEHVMLCCPRLTLALPATTLLGIVMRAVHCARCAIVGQRSLELVYQRQPLGRVHASPLERQAPTLR